MQCWYIEVDNFKMMRCQTSRPQKDFWFIFCLLRTLFINSISRKRTRCLCAGSDDMSPANTIQIPLPVFTQMWFIKRRHSGPNCLFFFNIVQTAILTLYTCTALQRAFEQCKKTDNLVLRVVPKF